VLEDDQIFLHLQERELEKAGAKSYAQACHLPTQADRYVLAYRKWVSDFQAEAFPGQALPPAMTKSALLDRYQSHTQHCGSCRVALQRIQRLRTGLMIVSAVMWSLVPLTVALAGSLSPLSGTLLTGIPLLAGALWLWLGRFERQFSEGRDLPPRNQTR
jgi:phenylpropionate dioxygenase-like ring-hydroxylating dioxygenase large terminal subunit